MNEIKVPHEYLDTLRHIRDYSIMDHRERGEVLDALIAAAEADQPPLPEGWYWVERGEGRCAAYVKDGLISPFDSGEDTWGSVDRYRNRITPLRPTVTEADVEKAAQALAITNEGDDSAWELAVTAERDDYRREVRAVFKAAEIEVSD